MRPPAAALSGIEAAPETAPAGPRPAWADRAQELAARDLWTANELADLGVPELPTTKRRIHDLLEREGVPFEVERANGGETRRYIITGMPRAMRIAIARHLAPWLAEAAGLPRADAAPAAPDLETAAASQQALMALPGKLALRADSRAWIVRSFEAWSRLAGLPGHRGAPRYCDAYAGGQVQAPDWVRQAVPEMCSKSLLTWQRVLARDGVRGLAGAYKPKQAAIDLDDDLATTAAGLIHDQPHLTARNLHLALGALWPDRRIPSLRAVERWLAGWKDKNRQLHAHLLSPDQHRSRFRPAFGRAGANITRLNQRWEFDSTPADVHLQEGRFTLLGVVDVWSRRAKLLVWPTSSAAGGGLLLRRALLDWGVAEEAATDNGADYTSRQYTRVLADLGIHHHLAPKFSPEKKPFIERFFRTFSHGLVPLLEGYAGHNVAEAAAIRSRTSFAQQLMKAGGTVTLKMTAAELQAFCDRWLADHYETREHSGLDTTPALKAASYSGPPIRRIGDERALDVLLAPLAGQRTVTKKGIRLDNGTFVAPELGSRVGEAVEVRRDPADMGRIYVFDAEGCFLCVAYDPDRVGIDPVAVAAAARANARTELAEHRRRLREAARGTPKGVKLAEAIMEAGRRQSGQVVAFPRPAAAHSTPALVQHGRAARADEAPAAAPRSVVDEERARRFAETERARAERATVNAGRAEAEARKARGLRLQAAIDAGAELAAEDAAWFERYRTTPEFRSALNFAREGGGTG